MFEVGDFVVKVPEGICKIVEVGQPDIPGISKEKQYFIMAPIASNASKVFIPVDRAKDRMRNVISKEEALSFIKSMPEIGDLPISNEKMREQEYKAALMSGDNRKIAGILKMIYKRKQERMAQGKSLTSTDDRYFKQAEDILYSELSFVLQVPKAGMEQYICDMIG